MIQKEAKKSGERNFSIIELIVAIIIFAVMALALAPRYFSYVEERRESADVQAAYQVATALVTYGAGRTDLPEVMTVTITKEGAACSDEHGSAALSAAGIADLKAKGRWKEGITVTYTPADGRILYSGEASHFYTTDGTGFAAGAKPEPEGE